MSARSCDIVTVDADAVDSTTDGAALGVGDGGLVSSDTSSRDRRILFAPLMGVDGAVLEGLQSDIYRIVVETESNTNLEATEKLLFPFARLRFSEGRDKRLETSRRASSCAFKAKLYFERCSEEYVLGMARGSDACGRRSRINRKTRSKTWSKNARASKSVEITIEYKK